MNVKLVLQIADLALSAAERHLVGTSKHDLAVGETLLEIIRKGVEVYEQHTGEPLDPSMIKPEQSR